MPEALVCAYARTPFGKFRGALSEYSATELGTMAVSELLSRAGIDPANGAIDQVYMGQVLQAGAGQRRGSGCEEHRESQRPVGQAKLAGL